MNTPPLCKNINFLDTTMFFSPIGTLESKHHVKPTDRTMSLGSILDRTRKNRTHLRSDFALLPNIASLFIGASRLFFSYQHLINLLAATHRINGPFQCFRGMHS